MLTRVIRYTYQTIHQNLYYTLYLKSLCICTQLLHVMQAYLQHMLHNGIRGTKEVCSRVAEMIIQTSCPRSHRLLTKT